jgi:hypothetical protein
MYIRFSSLLPAIHAASCHHQVAQANASSPVDSDDQFEYRHVILPKQMLKLLPKA